MLTHISLFSGLGADDLAAEWAGFTTILQCEIDKDCLKVLKKHWPDVPKIEDVRNVTKESVIANTANKGLQRFSREKLQELFTTEGDKQRTLTLLTAGVPCQPASAAGKRRGQADDRWLWPEAIRVVSELKPAWAVFENPVGISSLVESGEVISMGSKTDQTGECVLSVELLNIITDIEAQGIEAQGYEVQPVSISAASIGAPHKRQRIFIIAHARGGGCRGRTGEQCGTDRWPLVENQQRGCKVGNQTKRCLDTDPDSGNQGLEGRESQQSLRLSGQFDRSGRDKKPDWSENWIEVASRLCSVDARSAVGLDGLSSVSKLKMLGNCNPPQMYYQIYKAIKEIQDIYPAAA